MPSNLAYATIKPVITTAPKLRHVRPIEPLRFPASEPEDEKMPESLRHARMRTTHWATIEAMVGREHTVGCDQFVYYDANDPRRALAPDVFVKLGVPQHDFDSYFAWEKGAPEIAFEILSPSDSPERWTFKEKLRRYHALGVKELVCFNTDAKEGKRLRVWDRIQHDLVERLVAHDRTISRVLRVTMMSDEVAPDPVALRLVDGQGNKILTPKERLVQETARADAEAARADAESARAAAALAERDTLLAKLALLEAPKRRSSRTKA